MTNNKYFLVPACGGSGNSFITCALSLSLFSRGEYKCLIVDASHGFSFIDYLCCLDQDAVMAYDDFLEGNCELDDIIYKTSIDNIDVLPSSTELTKPRRFKQLGKIIEFLSEYYDYVFIDTPSAPAACAMAKSTKNPKAIITTLPFPHAMTNCPQIVDLLYDNGFSDVRYILNCFKKNLFFNNDLVQNIDELTDYMKAQLLGVIPFDDYISDIPLKKLYLQDILDDINAENIKSKKSAIAEINRIACRLEGYENIFVKL